MTSSRSSIHNQKILLPQPTYPHHRAYPHRSFQFPIPFPNKANRTSASHSTLLCSFRTPVIRAKPFPPSPPLTPLCPSSATFHPNLNLTILAIGFTSSPKQQHNQSGFDQSDASTPSKAYLIRKSPQPNVLNHRSSSWHWRDNRTDTLTYYFVLYYTLHYLILHMIPPFSSNISPYPIPSRGLGLGYHNLKFTVYGLRFTDPTPTQPPLPKSTGP